ncbi:MAG: glycosyltransferase family 9 protein [Syntrophaceae bacterium]|nr:glycosyltransferase family 9 protein [Syntrophaceae bacterium]
MGKENWKLFRAAIFQYHLHECLTYFLHVSQAGSHRSFLSTGKSLPSEKLTVLNGICSRLIGESILPKKILATHLNQYKYAEILSRAFSLWKKDPPVSFSPPQILPKGKSYEEWFRTGGSQKKYWPVHELRKWLLKHGAHYFRHGLIHGSVGTLDDRNGFSDLDLAFIIRGNVILDKDALVGLRQKARQILIYTYAFDPLMHHGPYYLTEFDLSIYPQGLLPLVIYENGVNIFGNDEFIYVRPYNSEFFTDSLVEYFNEHIKEWANNKQYISDAWDVEVVLGTIMLLPSLYLQSISNKFRYKSFSFSEAKLDFTPDQWMPIEIATNIRSSLPERYRPPHLLVSIARLTGKAGFLPKRALLHGKSKQSAKLAQYMIGSDFAEQSLRLINSVRKKIADADVVNRSAPEEFLSALGDIQRGPFTDEPFKATMADYMKAKDYLIDRWTKSDKRPVAIYQLGSIGAAGHSDIDFIVVWPEAQPIKYKDYRQAEYPASIQSYMVHPPYFCTPKLWEKMAGWYPAFSLQHLWGEKLDLPKVPDGASKGIALGHLAASLHTKLPEDLFLFAMQKPIRLRIIINTLHSFKYTCQLAAMAGMTLPPDISELAKKIENLRENWIDNIPKPFDKLQQLSIEVCCALQIIHDLCIEAVDKSCSSRENPDQYPIYSPNLSTYAQHAVSCYFTTGSTPRLLTAGLARFLSLCAVFEPKMLQTFRHLGRLPGISINESIYTEGLRRFAADSVEYADEMIPLGVPATKYYSLGYSPKGNPINDGVKLPFFHRSVSLIKRAVSMTRDKRSRQWLVHKLKARINYFIKYCSLYPRLRLFRILKSDKPIIIISQLMHMGDIVACEPVARQLHEKNPGAYIIWCIDIRYQEIVKKNPHIKYVFSVLCMWEWSRLRDSGLFDAIIDLNVHERYCSRCNFILLKDETAQAIKYGTQYRHPSLLEAFSKGAGIAIRPERPLLYYSKKIIRRIDSLSLPSFFIVINCKSNEESRNIPRNKWIQVLNYLCNTHYVNVVEVGSSAFASIKSSHYFDLCNQLSILETAEVIRRAALFVGIDSGPAHLANAVQTPGILLMGHYLEFVKYMPYTGFYTDPKNVDFLWADGPAALLEVSSIINIILKRLEKEVCNPSIT